jgi:uridine kinase
MKITQRKPPRDDECDPALSTSCPIPRAGVGFWLNPNILPTHPEEQPRNRPFLIGVAGGTASGKTSVCDSIIQKLADHRVTSFSLDSFYRVLTEEELANVTNHNFDHPDAFDWVLLYNTMEALSKGKTVPIPTYDFTTHSRSKATSLLIHGSLSEIVIIEGILMFHDQKILDLFDMKLFVDTDSDTRLARRVRRDMSERGRSLDSVLNQYERFVKPAFDQFILPTKKYADVIIPRGSSNTVAIDLIVVHIKQKLDQKRASRERSSLAINVT